MSKKGQDKKSLIYSNAKLVLFEEGYTNATIKKIAKISEVPISSVHYYFKTKDEILRSIYSDFLNNIDFFLYKKKPEIFSNSILSHGVSSRIYYDIILNNQNNRRVYHEVLQYDSNYSILNLYIQKIYHKYIEENSIVISDKLLDAYIFMDFGARREFFIQYFEGNIDLSIQEMVSAINGLIPRLLKLHQHFIDSLLIDSISIFNSLDYSELKFLI